MNWPVSVFPTPDPNRLHIFPTRPPPPPAQPARPPLPHNLAHPHKRDIFTQLPAARFPHFNSRPWSQLHPFSSRWFCVSVVLVAHSQVENNTISYFGRMLRQSTATLVFLFLFLFFSRFYQTLFFQREKRCDNRYSTNGGASTWRQRTWSRGNASTQCHSSGNYWTSGLVLYCGCSSPESLTSRKLERKSWTGSSVEEVVRWNCLFSLSVVLLAVELE